MDIGNLKNNYTYYEGYEDEPEIILTINEASEFKIHLWEGYVDDIFSNPVLDGKGWRGFTRDIHQMEGAFSNKGGLSEIKPKEYLEDLLLYKEKTFNFEETADVFSLIVSLLEKSIEEGVTVQVEKV